ncbi:hypothetical protein HOC80_05415 [archaeon]|nr:hypothetical protein [archaeon]
MLKGVRGNLHSILLVGLIVIVFAGLFYGGITGFYTSPFGGGPIPFNNFDQFDTSAINLSLYQLTLVVGDPGVSSTLNVSVNSNFLFNVTHTGTTVGSGATKLYINTNIQQANVYTYINMTDTSSTVSASAEASSGIELSDDSFTRGACYLNLANTSQFRLVASNITGPVPYANVGAGVGNLSLQYDVPTTMINCTFRWAGGVQSILVPTNLNVINIKPKLFADLDRPAGGPGPINGSGQVESYFDFWNVTAVLPAAPPPPPATMEQPFFETFTGPGVNVSRFTMPAQMNGFNFSQSNNMIVMNGTTTNTELFMSLSNANAISISTQLTLSSVFNLTGNIGVAGTDSVLYKLGLAGTPTSSYCAMDLKFDGTYYFCADGNCTVVPKGWGNLTFDYQPIGTLVTCTYTNNMTVVERTTVGGHTTSTITNTLHISNASDSGYVTIDDLNYTVAVAPPVVVFENPFFETFTPPVVNVSRFTVPTPVPGFNFSQSAGMIVMNGTAVGLNPVTILDNVNAISIVSSTILSSVFNLTGSVANVGTDATTYRFGLFSGSPSFCNVALKQSGSYQFCANKNCTGIPKGWGNLTFTFDPAGGLVTCTFTNNVTVVSRTITGSHTSSTIRNGLIISNVSDSGYLTIDDLNYSIVVAAPPVSEQPFYDTFTGVLNNSRWTGANPLAPGFNFSLGNNMIVMNGTAVGLAAFSAFSSKININVVNPIEVRSDFNLTGNIANVGTDSVRYLLVLTNGAGPSTFCTINIDNVSQLVCANSNCTAITSTTGTLSAYYNHGSNLANCSFIDGETVVGRTIAANHGTITISNQLSISNISDSGYLTVDNLNYSSNVPNPPSAAAAPDTLGEFTEAFTGKNIDGNFFNAPSNSKGLVITQNNTLIITGATVGSDAFAYLNSQDVTDATDDYVFSVVTNLTGTVTGGKKVRAELYTRPDEASPRDGCRLQLSDNVYTICHRDSGNCSVVPSGVGTMIYSYDKSVALLSCAFNSTNYTVVSNLSIAVEDGPVYLAGYVQSTGDTLNLTFDDLSYLPGEQASLLTEFYETFDGASPNFGLFDSGDTVGSGINAIQNNALIVSGTASSTNSNFHLPTTNAVDVSDSFIVSAYVNVTSVVPSGLIAAELFNEDVAEDNYGCMLLSTDGSSYSVCTDGGALNCSIVSASEGNLTYYRHKTSNKVYCLFDPVGAGSTVVVSETLNVQVGPIYMRGYVQNSGASIVAIYDNLNYTTGEMTLPGGSPPEPDEGFGMCSSFNGNQASCLSSSDNVVCAWLNPGQEWCSPTSSGCCDQVSCQAYNGDITGCNNVASDLGCSWNDNQYNQNMWCPISSSNPYMPNGMPVIGTNIGCCTSEMCSDAAGTNQTYCDGSETNFMNSICSWETQATNPYCPDATGCCGLPDCGDVTTQTDCEYLMSKGQSCDWSGSICSSGGYDSYDGADSCVDGGGTWNGTACETPDYTDEASNARCWFADNQVSVCGNITGCVYCVAGSGYAGIANETSFCFNKQANWCEGHSPGAFAEGDPEAMTCSDIQLGVTCDCGPVPGCHWTNSSATTGAFCSSGVPQCDLDYDSLEFQQCEDATTSGDCNNLAADYFLPCTWNTGENACLFDFMAGGSGDQKGSMDFEFTDIMDEENCQFAGGSWNNVVIDSYGNTDSWCDFGFGAGMDTCNNSCWACEMQSDGTGWGSSTLAQNECETSNAVVNGCEFISFGGTQGMGDRWGWCDYPGGSEFFGGSCETMCYDCFGDDMCTTSAADCGWTEDPYGGGWCDPSSLANLQDPTLNCLAAKTETQCGTLADETVCQWNSTYVIDPFNGQSMSVCIEDGASPEICFMPGDEDENGLADCQDPVCSSDPMCGFGMGFGGEMMTDSFMLPPGMEQDLCFAYDDTNQSTCEAYVINQTLVFNGSTRGFAGLPAHLNNQVLCYYHTAPSGAQETEWCDPVFHEMMMGDMDNAPPIMLGTDATGDASSIDCLDITELGIKNEMQKMVIGVPVVNITDFAGCDKKIPGNSTQNGTFYRYLDTDDNGATGCTANGGSEGDIDLDGYDYKIVMQGTWNGTSSNNVLSAYECADSTANTWAPKSAALTFKDDFCLMEGGPGSQGINAVILTKNDFGIGSDNLRIYITTVFDDETDPIDTLGPFYFTPGSIDFIGEDCFGFVDKDGDGDLPSDDADCSFINNLGFMPFEDCGDGIDNNADGLTDCNDYMCTFTPMCNGNFGFSASGTDNTAPQVIYHTVDAFDIGAFVKFDTNEPANGSVLFYSNDSTCTTLNKSLHDTGDPMCIGAWCDFDDYKLWHDLPIDNFAGAPPAWKLGYDLTNGTTYFYRYKVCDPDSNCATSACVNFTTKGIQPQYYFDMEPPTGFSVKMPWDIEGSGFAKQVNFSVAKNIDINITCADAGYEIRLVGADIKGAQDLDVSSIVCSGSTGLIGMTSTVWNQLLFGLSVDYVEITWAVEEGATTAQHCDNDGLNCVDVNDYLDCVTTDTSWTCKIPLTLGFSTYKVVTPTGEVASATVSAGSGGATAEGLSNDEEEEEEEADNIVEEVVDDVAEAVDEGVQRVSEFVGDIVGEEVVQNTWVWVVVGGLLGLGVITFVVLKKTGCCKPKKKAKKKVSKKVSKKRKVKKH